MEKYYIWLIMVFRPSNPVIHEVMAKYGSAENAYNAISGGDHSLLTKEQINSLGYTTLAKAERVADKCKTRGFDIVLLGTDEYPKLLAEIFNPPLVIFKRGNLYCLDNLSITIVGAREVTDYIRKLGTRISKDLAKNGITLVSGMARGTDSCAHYACVDNGFPTVGVLACGIDHDYPAGSSVLKARIVESGGAYISELLPGTPPSPDYFKARNRILAGLSRGTAVFQAGPDSGSLITAAYAADENRDVFCIPPPNVFDSRYTGVVSYLRDGAIPVFNHDDILKEYKGLYI